eukprot:CFRG3969T1
MCKAIVSGPNSKKPFSAEVKSAVGERSVSSHLAKKSFILAFASRDVQCRCSSPCHHGKKNGILFTLMYSSCSSHNDQKRSKADESSN